MIQLNNTFQEFLKEELGTLKDNDLLRALQPIESAQDSHVIINKKEYLNLCSNNYLGLANHPYLKEAALDAVRQFGCSGGASRLICGDNTLLHKLEDLLTAFKGTENSIVFNNGYMANVGTIASIVDRSDIIFSDRLNHASIVDGCLLSGARLIRYPHKDVAVLESLLKKHSDGYKKRLIVTDSVFSMDGDIAPLECIIDVASRFNTIVMVDEAHATGVFGQNGGGIVEELGLKDRIDIQMGTLSKAIGSLGGFVAGSKELIEYLVNKARPFIYTTALAPSVIASSMAGIELVTRSKDLRKKLLDNIEFFRNELKEAGFNTLDSCTQIIPVLTKENSVTMKFSKRLFDEGILVQGIRPPTVPVGLSRLRISIMATHRIEDLKHSLASFSEIGKELGVI